jgi:hypothetical protein
MVMADGSLLRYDWFDWSDWTENLEEIYERTVLFTFACRKIGSVAMMFFGL